MKQEKEKCQNTNFDKLQNEISIESMYGWDLQFEY